MPGPDLGAAAYMFAFTELVKRITADWKTRIGFVNATRRIDPARRL
jgi:hypothetical protein